MLRSRVIFKSEVARVNLCKRTHYKTWVFNVFFNLLTNTILTCTYTAQALLKKNRWRDSQV